MKRIDKLNKMIEGTNHKIYKLQKNTYYLLHINEYTGFICSNQGMKKDEINKKYYTYNELLEIVTDFKNYKIIL
jgi:hypothetical protein